MAISYVGQGGAVALAASAAPAYPAGIAAGDVLILWAASNAAGVGAPSDGGWAEVGSGAAGGNVWARCWTKTASGSESGTLTVTAAGTAGEAHISAYRGSNLTVTAGTFGTDTSTGSTAFSAAGASVSTVTGDRIVETAVARAPTGTYSGSNMNPNLTQAGASVSFTARFAGRTGSNVLLYQHGDAAVTAGGTGAPTVTGTTPGANAAGVAAFVVLREVTAISGSTSGTGDTTGTLTPIVTGETSGEGATVGAAAPAVTGTQSGAGGATGALTPRHVGTSSGTGAATGAMRPAVNGTTGATGATTGAITPRVTGSTSGTGAASGALDDQPITGSTSGTGGSTGAITPTVAGAASATGGTSGTVRPTVAGSGSGQAATTGTMRPTVTGQATATGNTSGTVAAELAGTTDGQGATSGEIVPVLTGDTTGEGSATGGITPPTPPAVPFTVTIGPGRTRPGVVVGQAVTRQPTVGAGRTRTTITVGPGREA